MLAARINPDEVAAMSPAEHAQAFLAFVAGMLADADRDLAGVVLPRLANAPGDGRRRRLLYTALLPGPETKTMEDTR
ncbi:MAG TPA: hypothetical protein VHV49_10850 [Pseudonocardiaceae bacterium]|nr:hypothetical protein [Pseudonocardiaceae bacterium]